MQLNQLTFFRFLAAAIVVIFHHGYFSGLAGLAPALLTAGPEMVSFFFVLSGFIMIVAYAERPRLQKKIYYLARFARVAPVYFLALLLSWLLSGGELDRDWRSALLGATFLQAWLPPYPRSLNIPGWSLSVEAFFYAIFPFLLLYYRQARTRTIVGGAILLWLASQALLIVLINSKLYSPYPSVAHDLIYFLPLTNLNAFLVGTAGGIFYLRHLRLRPCPPRLSVPLLLLALTLVYQALSREKNLYNLSTLFHLHKIPEGPGILAPLYLFLILALAIDRSWLQKILSWSPLIFLGEISYSMYILQHPFNLFFAKNVAPYVQTTLGLSGNQNFYIFSLCLILLCALSYTQLETPIRRYLTALPHRRGSAPPLPSLEASFSESKPRE